MDCIKVPENTVHTLRVRDNQTVEGKLIDVSAPGALLAITAFGSDWELRNIGVKGATGHRLSDDRSSPKKVLRTSVAEGGTGLIENVYLGDGVGHMDLSRDGGIFVVPNHKGDLTIRDVNLGGWADNGIYGSAPARRLGPEGCGQITISRCYGRNNNTASFRVGGEGDKIRRSTAVVDGPIARKPRPVPASPGVGRGIWCKDGGHVEIDRCRLVKTHSAGTNAIAATHGATATVTNTEISGWDTKGDVELVDCGDSPRPRIPYSVPRTPKEAAEGN